MGKKEQKGKAARLCCSYLIRSAEIPKVDQTVWRGEKQENAGSSGEFKYASKKWTISSSPWTPQEDGVCGTNGPGLLSKASRTSAAGAVQNRSRVLIWHRPLPQWIQIINSRGVRSLPLAMLCHTAYHRWIIDIDKYRWVNVQNVLM